MFACVKNLYHYSNGLMGAFLLRPLKEFRSYFRQKKGIHWKLLYGVLGLFVYPAGGLLSMFGIFLCWLSLCEKNSEVNNFLDYVMQKIQEAAAVDHSHFEFSCDKKICWDERPHKHMHVYSLTKVNCREKQREVENKIQELTKKGILCSCACKGTTAQGNPILFTLFPHTS